MAHMSMDMPITKMDEDKRLVYGWASIIEKGGKAVSDHEGDVIEEAELVAAAHRFMEVRAAGEMHQYVGKEKVKKKVGHIVESCVFTKAMQEAIGIDLGHIGWWIVAKIDDDNVWKNVKDGVYKSFSIGGKGTRVSVEG